MNYRMITYILGWILIFEGLFLSLPTITSLIYNEYALWKYILSLSGCLLIGSLLVLKKPAKQQLYAREGGVSGGRSGLGVSACGAVPTTGASILSDVEALSHASLMWRSFTHWVGGMGVLVFIMAFIPLSGAQNMHLMKAESP